MLKSAQGGFARQVGNLNLGGCGSFRQAKHKTVRKLTLSSETLACLAARWRIQNIIYGAHYIYIYIYNLYDIHYLS